MSWVFICSGSPLRVRIFAFIFSIFLVGTGVGAKKKKIIDQCLQNKCINWWQIIELYLHRKIYKRYAGKIKQVNVSLGWKLAK